MKKEIAVAMVVMALSLVSVVSVNANQAGGPYLDKIDSPDYFQTDLDYGGFESGGGTYCGPVAASNALMWLDAHGFGNIVDDTTDRKKDQYDLIDILGSENYMDSIDGTGAFGLTRGLNRYLNERGYNVTFRSEGWRNVPDYVNVVATKPQVPWIKEAVTGANSGCLLNVGWYEYYNNNNTYIRKGGHWITVVGYGIDEDGGYCPDCIIIHDPAPRAGTDFRNHYTTFEEIQSGTIVHDNTRENARGYYIVHGMVNKDGYVAIPDSAVEFRIPKCCHELDFYGTYEMVHDGNWGGILTLQHNPYFDNDAVCDNIAGTYKALWNNETYDVYGYTLKTTKGDNFCWYAGFWLHGTDCEVTSTPSGPKVVCSNLTDEEAANKIIFYVNFSEGRQRFDGYLFMWTKNAIAGITWWNNKPFGFYAIKEIPDLVIGNAWVSNNKVYYKIKNQGSANSGVSYTSLSVDGVFKASDYVAPLGAGAERTESFDYKWTWTPLSDTIKVCADYRGNVAESNEANNCITETWTCTELPRQLDIYFADAGESPGSVYHYNTTTGIEETVYTRPSRRLYSFSFYPAIPEKLYYVNANENKIYRTLQLPSGWTPEEVVYTHTTYVRDIAFAFDKDGELRLYFSEATGGGGNGKIYKIEDGKASLYYEVKLADVGGFWGGDFAFDDKGNLYLSSGNRIPASIYKVEEGKVKEIFKDVKECISGLIYADGALYYANGGTKIYRLDISTKERTVVYSNTKRTLLSDVDFREVITPEKPALAYIYSTDTTSANSYKSLLDANGYITTLIPMSDAATTDFSKYDAIITGSDTGYVSSWDDSASVSAVKDSYKPIVGLGEGGYALFEQLKLDTGYPQGWHGDENSIYVVDTSHTIFKTLDIPKSKIIRLYASTQHVGIYLPEISSNIAVLGREVESTSHYPLTLEHNKYLLWGFTASPASMTQVGKDLFINMVSYMTD